MSFFQDFKNISKYFDFTRETDQVTFYSETANDWQHILGIIKELNSTTNFKIAYIHSDINDQGKLYKNSNFLSFKIKNRYLLTWLFKNIKSKVMIMTLPDLNQYHLKRSKYPVHYIYVPHNICSLHSIYRKGAFDHFDTMFCVGPHHVNEIKTIERIYNLNSSNVLNHLDNLNI